MNKPPVDTATLNELRSIMGDEFNLLIEIFISDSAQRIQSIEAAIAAGDAEALRGAAHSFKGSSLNMSAAQLTELCRQLEFMGRDNDMANAGAVFAEAKTEFAIVRNFLLNL
jgi:histidine phosphotransfer protein HptB